MCVYTYASHTHTHTLGRALGAAAGEGLISQNGLINEFWSIAPQNRQLPHKIVDSFLLLHIKMRN